MNVHLPSRMGKQAFLAWVQGREERYELADGRVVMMTGGSRGHALVVRKLAGALEKRLDPSHWTVLTSDFAASIDAETVRYPDVIVDATGGALNDLSATAPALIAEVLSPSSLANDLGDKATEYLRLPSLHAYLVLSQEEAKAWIWVRAVAGFAAAPEILQGEESVIRVPSLGIALPLSELYAGIAPDSANT